MGGECIEGRALVRISRRVPLSKSLKRGGLKVLD